MTPHRLNPVLRHVRSLGGAAIEKLADATLLARFVADGDEAAFAVLVRRHGPMVLGLCNRLLADRHAAEDAFQATFLVLAKKARWLRQPDRLGPWLYGVARRVALKARAMANRRREVAPVDVPAAAPLETSDLRSVLDAAIAGLPSRYRVPVVLCYLQGLTYAEAAERLRCPEGTVATRLSRARDRLRILLLRQGVVPAAGALTAALTPDATAALVPDELLHSTARWVAAFAAGSAATIPIPILTLTREVTQAMIFDKLKVLAVLVAFGLAGTGAGVALSRPAGPDAVAKPDDRPVVRAEAVPNPALHGSRPIPIAMLGQRPPDAYRVESGDVLGLFIEGVLGDHNSIPPVLNLWSPVGASPAPAIGFPVPVQEDGTILLPHIDPLAIRGKSVSEIRTMISDKYVKPGIIAPGSRVFVSVAKPRTYRVTVVSQNTHDGPSRTQLTSLDLPAYENDVLTALAKSSGLPFVAENAVVVIERGSGEAISGIQRIRIPLRNPTGQPLPFKPDDVILKNGDVISVEIAPAEPREEPAPKSLERLVAVTLAVAAPDGRILVQMPGGTWKMLDAAKITATETDGKPVAAVADRLKAMTAVLVAADGKPPTPQYLQLAKSGTLILIIKD